jgi:hypothetical protein
MAAEMRRLVDTADEAMVGKWDDEVLEAVG